MIWIVTLHHCAKFCQNRPSSLRDITIVRFSRCRLSAVLDF